MGIRLSEHKLVVIKRATEDVTTPAETAGLTEHRFEALSFELLESVEPHKFRSNQSCFSIYKATDQYNIKADYYIGLSWLGKSGRYIYVEPKVNKQAGIQFSSLADADEEGDLKKPIATDESTVELNYLKMLLDVMSVPSTKIHTNNLVHIFWEQPPIPIEQKDDRLTPFLIIQFIQLVRQIVRKGLKKSYYKEKENLRNRIKGKILVGQHIKQNVFKNRLTQTFCEYQVFGEDSIENRFLKKVLSFAIAYVSNNGELFGNVKNSIESAINYISPAFESIGNEIEEEALKHFKHNPFFKEYKEAVKIGKYILKRFAFNITETSSAKVTVPPFWIDMPTLFELYVYKELLVANDFDTEKIKYQFSTKGNYLDILIKDGSKSIVIDAKYKMKYEKGQIHQDIRQVAGYARLNKVLDEVAKNNPDFDRDIMLPCLIVYPDLKIDRSPSLSICELVSEERKIKPYHKVYKLGIKLPVID